jgi:CotS family spore coat protein
MGEPGQEIVKYFGVKPKRIVKEKSYYILETETGAKAVRKSSDSAESLKFQHKAKELLHESGFPNTDRFSLSHTGEPFVCFAGELYVMTDLFDYKRASFYIPEELKSVVSSLALFHKLSESLPLPSGGAPARDLELECGKALSDLSSMKKKLGAAGRLTDFDVLFIKSCGFYQRLIKSVSQALSESGYKRRLKSSVSANSLCHNNLKETTVLADGQEIYLTRFSDAGSGLQLWDLACVISRYGRNSKGLGLSVRQILDAYAKERPIPDEDIPALEAMIVFPSQYLKTVRSFCGKRKPWLHDAALGRLEAIIGGQGYYDRFTGALGGALQRQR